MRIGARPDGAAGTWSLRDPAVHAILAIAAVFLPVLVLLSRGEYLLVNDLRPFQVGMPEADLIVAVPDYLSGQDVGWAGKLWANLVDPWSHAAWLYRPFPDLMECLGSRLLRDHPGAWRLATGCVRVATCWLVWRLVRRLGHSPGAACVATLYVAFFPALPEIHLTSAETWLAPALVGCLLLMAGLEREPDGGIGAGRAAGLVATFGLLTLSKEALAPLSWVVLACTWQVLRRRAVTSRAPRFVLPAMAALAVNQTIRFALAAGQPYARSEGAPATVAAFAARAAERLRWQAENLATLYSNALPAGAAIALLGLLGIWVTVRRAASGQPQRWTRASIVAGLAVCAGLVCVSPHAAIRYLYPAGLLVAPLLAAGFDALAGSRALETTRRVAYCVVTPCLFVFGGACVAAQALAVVVSSRADSALLAELGRRFAAGGDVVVVDAGGSTERAHWIECEVKHLHLTSPASQSGPGRFRFVRPGDPVGPLEGPSAILPSNPGGTAASDGLPANGGPRLRFDFSETCGARRPLAAFRRFAVRTNPWFRYPKDAGSTAFPGHAWELVTSD